MLALTRKEQEKINITTPSGEVIVVTVGEIKRGNKVRLLFEADKAIVIDRMEIAERKVLAG